MPTLPILDAAGKSKGTLELLPAVFGGPVKMAVLHQAVVRELADRRTGTHSTLGRSEVRGGGRKPWRQKGTGRARAGMTSSPLWRGGGRIFPNKPDENFTQKVNKKMYRGATCFESR